MRNVLRNLERAGAGAPIPERLAAFPRARNEDA
jgi:hypothetical protein